MKARGEIETRVLEGQRETAGVPGPRGPCLRGVLRLGLKAGHFPGL